MEDERIAICEMNSLDIKTEISTRQFELLDPSLDNKYRRYIEDRLKALKMELEMRCFGDEENEYFIVHY